MYNDFQRLDSESYHTRCESSRLYIILILILAVHGRELLYRRQVIRLLFRVHNSYICAFWNEKVRQYSQGNTLHKRRVLPSCTRLEDLGKDELRVWTTEHTSRIQRSVFLYCFAVSRGHRANQLLIAVINLRGHCFFVSHVSSVHRLTFVKRNSESLSGPRFGLLHHCYRWYLWYHWYEGCQGYGYEGTVGGSGTTLAQKFRGAAIRPEWV